MTTYEVTDKIIDEGNIDEIRAMMTKDPKAMLKGLIYKKKMAMAIATIKEFGINECDYYVASRMSGNDIVKIIDHIKPIFVLRAATTKEKMGPIIDAYVKMGVNFIKLIVDEIAATHKMYHTTTLGEFLAVAYTRLSLRPDDIIKYEKSYLTVCHMVPYSSMATIIDLLKHSIRLDYYLCVRSIIFKLNKRDNINPRTVAASIIPDMCHCGSKDVYDSLCGYVGHVVVRNMMTRDDIDNLGKCGALSIISDLGGIKDGSPSSLLYHASYNDHCALTMWLLDRYPDMMAKAIESAVKGMAVNVINMLVKANPIICLPKLPADVMEYVIKMM